LHGVGGNGNNFKSVALKEYFGKEIVESPTIPIDPKQTEVIVNEIVLKNSENGPLVFVGSSLGGFWANYFAQRYNFPCVLINPATTPSILLKKFNVEQEILDSYKKYETVFENNGNLINLFLASDDDVIPFRETQAKFSNCSVTAIFPSGGHRFESNWPLVIKRVESILKSY